MLVGPVQECCSVLQRRFATWQSHEMPGGSSPLVVPPVTLIFVFELLVDDTPLSQMQKSAVV